MVDLTPTQRACTRPPPGGSGRQRIETWRKTLPEALCERLRNFYGGLLARILCLTRNTRHSHDHALARYAMRATIAGYRQRFDEAFALFDLLEVRDEA
jgi:hypothetical protein